MTSLVLKDVKDLQQSAINVYNSFLITLFALGEKLGVSSAGSRLFRRKFRHLPNS